MPTGFGDFGGSLVAAAGSAGIIRVTTGEAPAATTLINPAELYVDVAFSGTALFALDVTNDEIDTVSAAGTRTTLAGTAERSPIRWAWASTPTARRSGRDAGGDVLSALPVAGGAPSDRAPYDFDASAPSGIAYDGVGTIAFVTRGSVVVRGSAVPRIDAASANFGPSLSGPTVGYGDLELDRNGAFVLVANDTVDPMGNFLFRATREGIATVLNANVGAAGEELLSLAIDPATRRSTSGPTSGTSTGAAPTGRSHCWSRGRRRRTRPRASRPRTDSARSTGTSSRRRARASCSRSIRSLRTRRPRSRRARRSRR